jgi:hypothetical protein
VRAGACIGSLLNLQFMAVHCLRICIGDRSHRPQPALPGERGLALHVHVHCVALLCESSDLWGRFSPDAGIVRRFAAELISLTSYLHAFTFSYYRRDPCACFSSCSWMSCNVACSMSCNML